MVFLSNYLFRIRPSELGKHLKRNFIDKLRIFVKSGDGGTGIKKLGGIGGNGGNICIQANNNITLRDVYRSNLFKRYKAENGESSKKLKLYGQNGKDVIINVPSGVSAVTDLGVCIGEVNTEGEKLIICHGGKGGSPLNHYTAQKGNSFSVNLDLKLIADIGLIGFPNAGKSTLLSLVSRARPKIANYPFTTLNPQLGTIEYGDKRVITMADLPGLIEGAHYNRGMGHKFLKHISRTKLNLFVVDINGFQLNMNFQGRSAFETVVFLNKELELFDESLVSKPSILVINKMDSENAIKKFDEFMRLYNDYEKSVGNIDEYWRPTERVQFHKIIDISAKNNQNVEKLCLELRDLIDKVDDKQKSRQNQNQALPLEENEKQLVDSHENTDKNRLKYLL